MLRLTKGLLIAMSIMSVLSFAFLRPSRRLFISKGLASSKSNLNFYSTPEDEIKELFKIWGQPTFRYNQVKKWVYDKGELDFDKMNDLPLELRQKLLQTFSFGSLKLIEEQTSKDGTRKRAYELNDG